MPEEEKDNAKNQKALSEKKEKTEEQEIKFPEEVLEQIPPEARKEVKRAFSMVSAGYMGPPPHPFAKKLTEEHITKIIDNVDRDDQREFDAGRDIRKMALIIFFAILISVTGLIVFFTLFKKSEIIIPLITAIVVFGGGFGGGYGIGKSKK